MFISSKKMNRNYLLLSFVIILIVSLIAQSYSTLDFICLIETEKESETNKIEESKETENVKRPIVIITKNIFTPNTLKLATSSINIRINTLPNETNSWNVFNHSPPAFLA